VIVPATKCMRACLVACCLVINASASAEESKFYESLADVEIGRIFLSPEERARLDARRGEAAAVTVQNRPGEKGVANQFPDAAGYIVSSSGRSRIWSKGGFVTAEKVPQVTFPGDVTITRRAVAEPDAEPGAADDGR